MESIRRRSSNVTEIYFGDKPTPETLWEGCWNPAYSYKKKLNNLYYYPVLKIINNGKEPNKIIDINIAFYPNVWKYPKTKENMKTDIYNWVNPYFWLDNGFYPRSNMRIEDEYSYINRNTKSDSGFKRPPIEEDYETIFNDIWKICVLKEGKASMSQSEFANYIRLIRLLVENAIIFPLKTIDYASWDRYVHQYLDEAISIFENNTHNLFKGWHVTKEDDAEKIQSIFISDIKKVLNLFYEKVKPDNGLGMFLSKIYSSFADELIRNKLFIKCLHCGLLAEYLKNKKYCSILTDGRSCAKRAHNKSYYATTGQKRLPKYRQTTKDLRAFYKEKGVKK